MLLRVPASVRRLVAAFERRPALVVSAAAVLAVAAVLGLGYVAGYGHVRHWLDRVEPQWLAVCFAGELIAYVGYVLAVRDTARVDEGPELGLSLSTQTVVAGFGVFAATRSSGGFHTCGGRTATAPSAWLSTATGCCSSRRRARDVHSPAWPPSRLSI